MSGKSKYIGDLGSEESTTYLDLKTHLDLNKWVSTTASPFSVPDKQPIEENIKEARDLLFWFREFGDEGDEWAVDALEKIIDRLKMEGL